MTKTIIDFYAYRAKVNIDAHRQALQAMFAKVDAPLYLQPKKGGWRGYTSSYTVYLGDHTIGMVAEGGEYQRGWSYVSLTGQGCSWIRDWDKAQEINCNMYMYQAKRVDIAHDTSNKNCNFDSTLGAYRAGGFQNGQTSPKCEPMKPERPQDSAIIRIGNRERDKYFRWYEKGKEQLGPEIAALDEKEGYDESKWTDHTTAMVRNGKVVEIRTLDWVRHEVEFKPKTAPLPQDLISKRDQYFAGAYPYLGTLLDADPLSFTLRTGARPKLDLELALAAVRRQYGNTIFTALHAHGGDINAVWDKICGTKHNDRLLDAGVLLVDHE